MLKFVKFPFCQVGILKSFILESQEFFVIFSLLHGFSFLFEFPYGMPVIVVGCGKSLKPFAVSGQ